MGRGKVQRLLQITVGELGGRFSWSMGCNRQHVVTAVLAFGMGMVFHELLTTGMGSLVASGPTGSDLGSQGSLLGTHGASAPLGSGNSHPEEEEGGGLRGPSEASTGGGDDVVPRSGTLVRSPAVPRSGQPPGVTVTVPGGAGSISPGPTSHTGMAFSDIEVGEGDSWYQAGLRGECDPLPPLPSFLPCAGPDVLKEPSK